MSRSCIAILFILLLTPCCAVRHATGEKLYPEEDRNALSGTLPYIDSSFWQLFAFIWIDTAEWRQNFGDVGLYRQYAREQNKYTILQRPSHDTLHNRFVEREFFKTSLTRYHRLTARNKQQFVSEVFRLIRQQQLTSPYRYMAYWMQAMILFDRHQYADAQQYITLAIQHCILVHERRDLAIIYSLAASIAANLGDWQQCCRLVDQAIASDVVQAAYSLYRDMPAGYAVRLAARGDAHETYLLSTYESLIHYYNNSRNCSYDPQHEELIEQYYFHRCYESYRRLLLADQFSFIAHTDSLIVRYSLQSPYRILFDLCVASYNDSIWNLDIASRTYQHVYELIQHSSFSPLVYSDSLALRSMLFRRNRLGLLQGSYTQYQTVEELDSIRNTAHHNSTKRLWIEEYQDYVLGYYEVAMAEYHQQHYGVADSLLNVYFGLCERPDRAMVRLGAPQPESPIEPALNIHCCIGNHLGQTELLKRLARYRQYQASNVTNYLLSLPELERDYAWNRMVGSLNQLHNASLLSYQSPAIAQAVYDNALHTRTLALSSSRMMDRIAALPQSQQRDSLLQLNTSCWQDVAQQLDSTQAAIEVVMARPIDNPQGDATYYAVILSSRTPEPQMVKLCASSALDSLLQCTLHGNARNIDALYTWQQLGARLYQLCFAPLCPYLQGIETIYIAQTGILNQININAIPCSETERLMDRFLICNVSTTAVLPTLCAQNMPSESSRPMPFSTACVYGGLDYYAHAQAPTPASALYRDYRDGLLYLANSGSEADTISQILNSHGCHAITYMGADGTEKSVKALDGDSPQLLHFATHSFYIGDDTLRQERLSPGIESLSRKLRPLRYTGLHLSCSAPAWYGKGITDGDEDGLLTAEEIAHLDLSQTRLAVLSACSSGLGKIDEVDGVIGLQRAFKRAGVQSLLVSLWPVPDEATKLLMQYFYLNLMTGENCHQALAHAMQHLRHDARYEKPHYWAGFIMLD